MLNTKLLSAWPNYLTVPVILAFWIVIGVLGAKLLGAAPHMEQENQ